MKTYLPRRMDVESAVEAQAIRRCQTAAPMCEARPLSDVVSLRDILFFGILF